jgi:hypothetical protein
LRYASAALTTPAMMVRTPKIVVLLMILAG